jgi:hypothetical protein
MQHTAEITHSRKREDLQSCRFIEAICFAVFLPIALLASLGGWRWHPWPPGPKGYGSVIGEARSMARTIAGIAVSV